MLTIEYDNHVFTIADIDNLPNLYRVIDPISYDLEYDVFNFNVKSDAIGEQKLKEKFGFWLSTASDEGIIIDNGDFSDFVYGRPVKIFEDGQLKATMYVTDISPINQRDRGEELFHVECVSSVGILSRIEHYGGLYVGTSAGSIIADIMGGLPYTIDSGLAAELLYGWLPYVKDARKNLNKVLFATGATITRNASGNVHFTYNLQDVAKQIPKDRTFYGGINSKKEHKSSVTVIEHGYYQSLEATEELIFDNTQGVAGNNTRITFDEPYYDYRGDGLTVVQSSANWAIITGVGYLYAKKYVHTQRPVSSVIDTIGEPEVLQVSDQTLVSSLNVNGVVDRLTNYYSTARIRSFDIEVADEKPGDLIEFYDRRDHVNTGYIKSIDESASSFWRGSVNAVTNWTPTKSGNDFHNFVIVTAADLVEGVWNVPAAMQGHRARVVLFSGAEGGQGGYAGETMGAARGGDKRAMPIYPSGLGSGDFYVGGLQSIVQQGGAGGKGGKGGASATRFVNIDIEELGSSYAATFGAGGEGGAGGTAVRDWKKALTVTEPELGQPGQDSVFNGTSTAYGSVFRGTYVNLVTGEILVKNGEDGIEGGAGGRGGNSEQISAGYGTQEEAQAYDYASKGEARGANGSNLGQYAGGIGAAGIRGVVSRAYTRGDPVYKYYAIGNGGGGGGGGAAMGGNGQAGNAASSGRITVRYTQDDHREGYNYINAYSLDEEDHEMRYEEGATGGDGADVTIIPSKPLYVGGYGGHGGGGGGGAGQCMSNYTHYQSNDINTYYGGAFGGKGGNGGKGGDGSDGFMIVYW